MTVQLSSQSIEIDRQQFHIENLAVKIGNIANKALLEEVYTTPKPGLVDCYSNGAHTDMSLFTFECSARVLKPYFRKMAFEGFCLANQGPALFQAIRIIGMEAEEAMFKVTKGVNTHKGLIFSIGILCAATASCLRKYGNISLKELIRTEQRMVRDTLVNELNFIIKKEKFKSNGERLYQTLGALGVRGEALSGFASVRKYALPVMRDGIYEGKDFNQVKLQTLMTLMSKVEDSNVLSRHNANVLYEVQECAVRFLQQGGAYQREAINQLKQLDETFIRRNISSGGCADLLAVSIFLNEIFHNFS